MNIKHLRWLLFGSLPLVSACNLLTPLAFVGEHKKKVSAEFDKLPHKRVAVLVWTDTATLFDYPYARFELASYITGKLQTETAQRNMGVDLVDSRDVEDYIQRNLDARINPQAVGRHFDTDFVVYVEVFEFQMREVDQPQFLRGRIHASTSVHDMRADPDQLGKYELTPVECVYPDGGPVLMSPTNAPLIREAVYRKFAEEVSRKFYEHTLRL